jgi:hypothetical protein
VMFRRRRFNDSDLLACHLRSLRARLQQDILVNNESGCWEWQAGANAEGYGYLTHQGVLYRAHRAAWLAYCGPIPKGMLVCHRCDNPPCCNPDHLFIDTDWGNVPIK